MRPRLRRPSSFVTWKGLRNRLVPKVAGEGAGRRDRAASSRAPAGRSHLGETILVERADEVNRAETGPFSSSDHDRDGEAEAPAEIPYSSQNHGSLGGRLALPIAVV